MSSETINNNNNDSNNIDNNFLQEVGQLRSKYDKERKLLMDKFMNDNITSEQFKVAMENLVNGENKDYKK